MPKVEWLHNNIKIEEAEDTDYLISNSEDNDYSLHTLKIMNCNHLLHEGFYFAKLTNHFDIISETNKAKLDIIYKPNFILKPESTIQLSGSAPLKLIYKIEGKPKPILSWYDLRTYH